MNEVYYPNHQEEVKAKRRARYAIHPEKDRADSAAAWAVKKGFVAMGPCENCGATKGIERHHPDYSKPLEFVCLCTPCHYLANRGLLKT
jgi:hypothetical protein